MTYDPEQQDLFSQPRVLLPGPMTRAHDLETSHEAAADAAPRVSENMLKALRLIAQAPRTDYELEAITGMQKNSIGKRRSDLYMAGLVEPQQFSGKIVKRPGPSGSMCIAWTITKAGRAWLSLNP